MAVVDVPGTFPCNNIPSRRRHSYLSDCHFCEQHKTNYVRSFWSRSSDTAHYGASSVADLISKFDGGLFRVPCVLLQCVGFDLEFYKELCRENDKFFVGKGTANIWGTTSGEDGSESEDDE